MGVLLSHAVHTVSTAVFDKLDFIQLDLRVSTRARKYECLRGGQLQNSGFVPVLVLVFSDSLIL